MSNMTVSYAPHIHGKVTTTTIMRDVIIALCPAFLFSIWVFGPRAALIVCVCVASSVFCEWAFRKALKREDTIGDLSAVVTGVLLAYNLPVTIPVWQAIFGSFVAIIFVKQLFGGLGKNFANPAITARVVMFIAFSTTMTTWQVPFDTITGATPLPLIVRGEMDRLPGLWDMALGVHGGCLGETSEILLLLGGLYLVCRKVITWHTPVAFIGTVFLLSAALNKEPVYQILSGGLFIGAIFMATDYVTAPLTKRGRFIFGIGAGILTVLIRFYGSYPEGVSFSILIMNILVPCINSLTGSKALGGVKS